MVGAAVAVACSSKWAGVPVTAAFVLSLLIALTPRGADIAILEARYSDRFEYQSGNEFYSERLADTFSYVRIYGDDYQSKLHEDTIVRHVKSLFPDGTKFGAITVTPVQTKDLYTGWADYYNEVSPTVIVQAGIPETYGRWDTSKLPNNIIVEGLP